MDNNADRLACLKAERDRAWAAFNPALPPSRTNDWVAFALASAEYHGCYRRLYGEYAPDDSVEVAATAYYAARRDGKTLSKAELGTKTDDDRDKGNMRRRVGPAAEAERVAVKQQQPKPTTVAKKAS